MADVVFPPSALGGRAARQTRFEPSAVLRNGGLALCSKTTGNRKLCILMDCSEGVCTIKTPMSKSQACAHGWDPRAMIFDDFCIIEGVERKFLQPMERTPCPMYCGWCYHGEGVLRRRDYYWLGPEFPDPHSRGFLSLDALQQHSRSKHPRKVLWGIPVATEYEECCPQGTGVSGTETSSWEPSASLREGGVAKLTYLDGQDCELLCILKKRDTHGLWTVDIKMHEITEWVRQLGAVHQEHLLPLEKSPCPKFCGYCYDWYMREDLPRALAPSGYFWCCGCRDPCSRGFESDAALEQHTKTWHPRRSPWGVPVTTLADEDDHRASQFSISDGRSATSSSCNTRQSNRWSSSRWAFSTASSNAWWCENWRGDSWSTTADASTPTFGWGDTEAENSGSSDDDKCVVCFERDRTGTIVHGETGHNCTCIECAQTLKTSSKPCPICREPIDMVVKVFKA